MARFTQRIPNAYHGNAEKLPSIGRGNKPAHPELVVLRTENGYEGDGLDICSNVGIAIGEKDGYMVPASDEVKVIGFRQNPIFGTKKLLTNGTGLNAELNDQLTPTIWTWGAQFKTAVHFDGAVAELAKLLDVKPGDKLRPVSKAELELFLVQMKAGKLAFPAFCDTDEKKKGYYAGTMVKVDLAEITELAQVCAICLGDDEATYVENVAYQTYSMDYDVQGEQTKGHLAHVHEVVNSPIANATAPVRKILYWMPSL